MDPMLGVAFIFLCFSIFAGVFLLVFHIQDKRQARKSKPTSTE